MLKQSNYQRCWLHIVISGIVASAVFIVGVSMLNEPACKTSYVYAPGLFGSPVVIGRYCRYYKAPTGEEIHGTRGGSVLGDGTLITAVVFPEVNITVSSHWFRRLVYPVVARNVLFSMFGIVVKEKAGSAETFFNYLPEVQRANIGQEEDIQTLRNVLNQHIKNFPGTHIVLYGDSRGAATIFNLLALDHPPVLCAVLEGVFDDIHHLIKHCWRWKSKHEWVEKTMHNLLAACTRNYSPQGPFPIDYAKTFPLDTPILLVTSLRDEVVPYQSTMRLYCELLNRGHKKVHLLVLKHSSHKGYMVGDDREAYETCVHAFYRFCGADYEGEKAKSGQAIFEQTQPSIEEVRKQYKLDMLCCQELLA